MLTKHALTGPCSTSSRCAPDRPFQGTNKSARLFKQVSLLFVRVCAGRMLLGGCCRVGAVDRLLCLTYHTHQAAWQVRCPPSRLPTANHRLMALTSRSLWYTCPASPCHFSLNVLFATALAGFQITYSTQQGHYCSQQQQPCSVRQSCSSSS